MRICKRTRVDIELTDGIKGVRVKNFFLKGVFAKNERGYRLNVIKKRF